MIELEYRARVEVKSPVERPAEEWERLHRTLERRLSAFGPVMERWPDRPSSEAAVTLSTDAAEPVDAGRMLTDAVYLGILAAGLGDCYVSGVELAAVDDTARAVA